MGQNNTITLNIAGANVTLPAATLTALWLEKLQTTAARPTTPGRSTPRIGDFWENQGGVYAGIVRGEAGAADYHLIVASTIEVNSVPWDAAEKWAKALQLDGNADFTLPKRNEQAVMFGNVPELFEKAWYWSSEQYASDSAYAWAQDFSGGTQITFLKNYELRARAVRRLII